MNKIEKIELEKSVKDLQARNNELKVMILAENSLGNAEKLDAEYQANEIKITDAQNKLNENKNGETKMTKKYIESKNSISDFMTILKDSNNKQDVKNKWNAKLAENGLEIKDELQKTIKKASGAEKSTVELVTLQAKQERISQTRLDEFSMQGLKKVVRYSLNNIGDYEHEIFDYFRDDRGTRYKRTVWERDTKTNKIILEGVVANGI